MRASIFLLAVIGLILFVDYAQFSRRGKRVVIMELVVFALGGILVAFPEIAVELAHLVGIGRGVDVVIYVALIWLTRESIFARHTRWQENERLTQLVRTQAIESARRRSAAAEGRDPPA